MGRIEINDIRVYAYHGCLREESLIGGNYLINVVVFTDFSGTENADKLVETLDYAEVIRIVQEQMKTRSKLIEHVSYRILDALKQSLPGIDKAEVKLTKLAPPVNGDVRDVTVVVEG